MDNEVDQKPCDAARVRACDVVFFHVCFCTKYTLLIKNSSSSKKTVDVPSSGIHLFY